MSKKKRDDPPDTIGRAIHETIIRGIRKSGPQAIGIVLCGVPLLGLATLAHYLIGSVPLEVLAGASGVGVGTVALMKSRSPAD